MHEIAKKPRSKRQQIIVTRIINEAAYPDLNNPPSTPIPISQVSIQKIHNPRGKVFKDIQAHFSKARKQAVERLTFEQTKTTIKEKVLRSIASHYYSSWKLMQNKMVVLSLVRSVLKERRKFGMLGCQIDQSYLRTAKEDKRKRYLIYPGTKRFQVHMVFLFIFFVYVIVCFPLYLAFGHQKDSDLHQWLILIALGFFMIDMGLRFFTSFEDNGYWVHKRREITKRYIKSFFVFDLICSVPFELLVNHEERILFLRLIFVFRTLKMLNTVFNRTLSGNYFIELLKRIFPSTKSFTVFSTLGLTLLTVHIMSCIWVFIPILDSSANWHFR
jgi:hypothetical protein